MAPCHILFWVIFVKGPKGPSETKKKPADRQFSSYSKNAWVLCMRDPKVTLPHRKGRKGLAGRTMGQDHLAGTHRGSILATI